MSELKVTPPPIAERFIDDAHDGTLRKGHANFVRNIGASLDNNGMAIQKGRVIRRYSK